MFVNAHMIKLIAGACLWGMTSLAFAQAAAVDQKLGEFKSASLELSRLYASAKDEAAAKAVAAQIAAATKRQQTAEADLVEAMKKLDPNSQQDGKLMEAVYAEIQSSHHGVAEAQMNAVESQAVAKAKATEKK